MLEVHFDQQLVDVNLWRAVYVTDLFATDLISADVVKISSDYNVSTKATLS